MKENIYEVTLRSKKLRYFRRMGENIIGRQLYGNVGNETLTTKTISSYSEATNHTYLLLYTYIREDLLKSKRDFSGGTKDRSGR
jgi:hypothetical protein